MPSTTHFIQIISISTALVASGGIASYSLFAVPVLKSQPASRSLPSVRWLFSRGSHIFPQAAVASGAGLIYSAIAALPPGSNVTTILQVTSNGAKVNGYLAAAALAISIAPFTALVMIPNNFALIELNEKRGGARSQASEETSRSGGGGSAEDSVSGKGQAAELTDLSGPQSRTRKATSDEDDEKVREMLSKFERQNWVRAVLLGAGGVVGLWAALLP